MKEIREILTHIDALAPDERAVLATVVDLKGSGYRLPGARMLIRENGDAFGTVSGGCLEADVMERAKRVLASDRAEVFTYDTTSEENSVFSLNMGCRGVMRILLEPVDAESDMIIALRKVRTERLELTAATIIRSDDVSFPVGSRVILGRGEEVDRTSLLDETFPQLQADMQTFFGSESEYETIGYELRDGTAEFVFETIKPPVLLFVFGAGADAVPLADAAFALGWQVSVVDHRPAFLTRERFPTADELVKTDRDRVPEIAADGRTAIVSMNHNYERDKECLAIALRSDAFYVGPLGPKRRTGQILGELAERGETFAETQLARMRSPAGLDIGADTPEAIAVSIIAEIQSVLRRRTGGALRDRDAPIYDRK